MTDRDIVMFLRQFLATQSIDALLPRLQRWRKQLATRGIRGIDDPGASDWLSLFVLQASPVGNPRIEHNLRDVLGIRPYKG
jgi:hypothetical protein